MRALLHLLLCSTIALGCGSRSGVLSAEPAPDETSDTTTTTSAKPPSCFVPSESRPLPAFSAGDLCTAGAGALSGPTMAVIASRTLFALTAGDAAPQHAFFADLTGDGWSESSRQVIVRGEWIIAGDVVSRSPGEQPGEAIAEIVLADRSGKVFFTRRLSGEYKSTFTDVRVTGSDRGLVAYSFVSYPDRHTLEVLTQDGVVLASVDGMDPLTDPDEYGFVAVRDSMSPEVTTYWLDPCTAELRPTGESQRALRTSAESWGSRLVYTDESDNTLVVEGAGGSQRFPLLDAPSDFLPHIFDMHPSGWALVTTAEPLHFTALHALTGERREIEIVLPKGFRRYDAFTGGVGPGAFDSSVHELRVTSSGGVLLPLRNAATGLLFTSEDGQKWQSAGAPIGNVYSAKGVEAGATLLHVGNAFAVSLPAWDPAPPGVERIDYQSTQLIRPASGTSFVVEQAAMGNSYNHLYNLSLDGGCLATEPILAGDVRWSSALSGEDFTFPLDAQSSISNALQWATGDDVTLWSLE
jgi:hypothetical protein